MIRALLLDLDDTLLVGDMSEWGPPYYAALTHKVAHLCDAEAFGRAMKVGSHAMWVNDGQRTNAEAFAEAFFATVGCDRDALMPLFDDYYAREFDELSAFVKPDPDAVRLVQAALRRGMQVAIATQPVFPRAAIEARLRWAGLDVAAYPFAFITSYEVMGACKPHPHFFRTLLEALQRPAYECLMVGDNPDADLPARRYGLRTFWVDRKRRSAPAELIDVQGGLGDLARAIERGETDAW
ncbi:MAG: HAD family hydrolase [Chloroflexi bacterium]|nr:HAD family hydrolase [Chloroflexota bacterium]